MANGETKTEVLPFKAHRFVVRFESDSSIVGAFTSISGLRMENQPLSFRSGNDNRFVKTLLPGLTDFKQLTLSKGVIGDDQFLDWIFNSVFPGLMEGPKGKSVKRNIEITAMNDMGKNGVTWRLLEALPVSYELGEMDASRSAVLVESLGFSIVGIERVVENQNTLSWKVEEKPPKPPMPSKPSVPHRFPSPMFPHRFPPSMFPPRR